MIKKLLLISTIILTGCNTIYGEHGLIKDHNYDYRTDKSAAVLAVPPDLTTVPLSSDLTVPEVAMQSSEKSLELIPPDSLADQIAHGRLPVNALRKTQIRLDDKNVIENTLLVIPEDVNAAWGLVGEALPKAGYRIIHKNKETGMYFILDTSVTHGKLTKDTPIYEVRLQQSSQSGTEVYLTNIEAKPLPNDVNTRVTTDINDALHGKAAKGRFTRWFSELLD